MALDQAENFVREGVSASITSTDTTISVDNASAFPDPATSDYNLVLWDFDTYDLPSSDPNVEIVRVTGRDTTNDELTVTRGQEGTSGASHPDTSVLLFSWTAKMRDDTQTEIDAKEDDTHVTSHENGGADELNVGSLSGDLADAQDPKTHSASHSDGGADELDAADLSGASGTADQVLTSDGSAANWQDGAGADLQASGTATVDDQVPVYWGVDSSTGAVHITDEDNSKNVQIYSPSNAVTVSMMPNASDTGYEVYDL